MAAASCAYATPWPRCPNRIAGATMPAHCRPAGSPTRGQSPGAGEGRKDGPAKAIRHRVALGVAPRTRGRPGRAARAARRDWQRPLPRAPLKLFPISPGTGGRPATRIAAIWEPGVCPGIGPGGEAMICEGCGREFRPRAKGPRAPRHCSDRCRWRARHARRHPPPPADTGPPTLDDLAALLPTLNDLLPEGGVNDG
jgi:hypothetical protein